MTDSSTSSSQPVWNLAELSARVDNDHELLRDLLVIFKEDSPRMMQPLRSAVAAGEAKSVASLSHTLRGMLSNLAATRAAAAAAELERLAGAANKSSFQAALDRLEAETAALVPEIEAYLAEVHI